MNPADDYNARVAAFNMHLQDRSRTPEEWFAFLTEGQPNGVLLHPVFNTPPYDQDTEEPPSA